MVELDLRHRGPRLTAVASVFVALFAGSLVSTAVLSGTHIPSPYEPVEQTLSFFRQHGQALRISGFLQFGAMMPLAIFSATSYSQLRFVGVSAAGPALGLVGGLLAAAMIGTSGLLQWVLAQGIDADVTRLVHLLMFAAGGVGTMVPFGLLVAGLAIAGGLTRNLPRWIMWFGVAVFVVAELSWLALLSQHLVYLLPVARFSGWIWMLCAAATLRSVRSEA